MAGDHITIADLALVASAANMQVTPKRCVLPSWGVLYNISKAVEGGIFDEYPKIKEWMERCEKEIPDYHKLNKSGAELFGKIGKDALVQCSMGEEKRHRPVGVEMPDIY